MDNLSRRKFLGNAAKLALAGVVMPQILPSRVLGRQGVAPSGKINFGLIGNGLMMQLGGHRQYFSSSPDTQVLAVCDVNEGHMVNAKNEVDNIARGRNDIGFKEADMYIDYQELLDRDDIDAVCIATPDHWHVPIALYAIQRGKAVYLEKPMTLTIEEGRILADAVKKYKGVLQVGSQQRSDWTFKKAAELIRNGYIGKVHTINLEYGDFPPANYGLPEQPVPEGFHYDKWLGPTPWYPYNEERVRGDFGGGWRCFLDYGARKEGDWGAHHFDIIQWALGMDDSGPTDFYPAGANGSPYRHYVYKDGPTVNINAPVKNGQMIQFTGDEGEILVSRPGWAGQFEATPGSLANMTIKNTDIRLHRSLDHRRDLLSAIKYGSQNICPAEVGHRSSTVCHLASISLRLNAHVKWDPVKEKITNNSEAAAMASRPRRAPYFLGA